MSEQQGLERPRYDESATAEKPSPEKKVKLKPEKGPGGVPMMHESRRNRLLSKSKSGSNSPKKEPYKGSRSGSNSRDRRDRRRRSPRRHRDRRLDNRDSCSPRRRHGRNGSPRRRDHRGRRDSSYCRDRDSPRERERDRERDRPSSRTSRREAKSEEEEGAASEEDELYITKADYHSQRKGHLFCAGFPVTWRSADLLKQFQDWGAFDAKIVERGGKRFGFVDFYNEDKATLARFAMNGKCPNEEEHPLFVTEKTERGSVSHWVRETETRPKRRRFKLLQDYAV